MKKNTNQVFIFSKKVSVTEKYNFYEYLGVMLDSGIGVADALESVNQKIKNPYFNSKLEELITFINSGDTFSKAMKKMPQIFSNSEISIIES
jgi:type II secretory pathway component PulF